MIKPLCLLPLSFIFLSSLSAEDAFTPLFDGTSLEGWQAAKSNEENPMGQFTLNKEEKAIHVYANKAQGSEQGTDCLVSKKQYSHFILKLEYKWGENRFAPRADWDRDAGLLFHVHGDLKKIWPRSLEMQIGESPGDKPNKKRFHSGDLFVLGSGLEVFSNRDAGFFNAEAKPSPGKHLMTKKGVEKPKGEWNQMEIRVHGSEKATFILNDEVVLELTDFSNKDKDGVKTPLSKGHIGLQAEWAEILYRNILIKELPSK